MGDSRRTFLKKSLAGAVLLGASRRVALPKPVWPIRLSRSLPKPSIRSIWEWQGTRLSILTWKLR